MDMQIILNSKVVFKYQVVFFMQPTVWSKNYKSCHSTPTPSPFLPPSLHNHSHNNLNCYTSSTTISPIATSYAMILLLGLVDLQYFWRNGSISYITGFLHNLRHDAMQGKSEKCKCKLIFILIHPLSIHPSTNLSNRCFHYCSFLGPPMWAGHQA